MVIITASVLLKMLDYVVYIHFTLNNLLLLKQLHFLHQFNRIKSYHHYLITSKRLIINLLSLFLVDFFTLNQELLTESASWYQFSEVHWCFFSVNTKSAAPSRFTIQTPELHLKPSTNVITTPRHETTNSRSPLKYSHDKKKKRKKRHIAPDILLKWLMSVKNTP